MIRKPIFLLLTMMVSIERSISFASDIAVENEDGVTIYYNYYNGGKELEVTSKGWDELSRGYEGIEILRIPTEVTYMGRTRKVTSIAKNTFRNVVDDSTPHDTKSCTISMYVIPPSITHIGEYAFWNTYLKGIVISDIGKFCHFSFGVQLNMKKYIHGNGYSLFSDLNTPITNIVIPDTVQSISEYAFAYCKGIKSITIPGSVTSIGEHAFEKCECTEVTLDYGVKSIGHSAFEGSTLTSITIPNSVTDISRAFRSCKGLTSVTIPNSVTDISGTFSGCTGLTSVVIPNSVTDIADAFSGCTGLSSVVIPNSVTTIGSSAFWRCTGLTSVTIPNSVTAIREMAFSGCSGLKSLIIGYWVTEIHSGAFSGDDNLLEIFALPLNPPTFYEHSYESNEGFSKNTFYNATLHVPTGSINRYKTASIWKDFVWIEEMDMTKINNIGESSGNQETYCLDGRRTSCLQKGINIIKKHDGTTKKVLGR